MSLNIREERQKRALTGLSEKKFNELLPVFTKNYQEQKQRTYQQGLATGQCQRKPGGGRNSKLKEMDDKLDFILYYLKTYPTYDQLGERFDLARSSAHDQVKALLPILQATLADLGVLPYRQFESVAAFQALCQELNLEQILLDVTERPRQRPQNSDQQQECYSGKKNVIPSKTW